MALDRRGCVLVAGSLLFAGCTGRRSGGGGSPAETAAEGTSGDGRIVARDTAFRPLKAEVDAGATVEWVNEDGFAHTVTSARFRDGAASWDFGERVAGGESLTHTFEESGVYEYYCTIHGERAMCGAVRVGGETLDGSLPCEEGGDGGDGGGGYY